MQYSILPVAWTPDSPSKRSYGEETPLQRRKQLALRLAGVCFILWLLILVGNVLFAPPPVDPSQPADDPSKYKFILHHTYEHCDESKYPAHWRHSPARWRESFPEATYRCWTDKDARELVAREEPALLQTFDAYPNKIQRVDVVRYVILKKFGGLYTDLDMVPTPDLVRVVRVQMQQAKPHSAVLFSSKLSAWWQPPSFQITNAIMLAPTPGSRFFDHVLSGLAEALTSTPTLSWLFGNYFFVLSTTGSRYLNLRYLNYAQRDDVYVFPRTLTQQGIIHLKGSSWHSPGLFSTVMRKYIHHLLDDRN